MCNAMLRAVATSIISLRAGNRTRDTSRVGSVARALIACDQIRCCISIAPANSRSVAFTSGRLHWLLARSAGDARRAVRGAGKTKGEKQTQQREDGGFHGADTFERNLS